jgi:hypothetical protein
MACADVAMAEAKTTAINLIIVSSYADLVSRASPLAKAKDERSNTRSLNPVRPSENG